MKLKQTVAQIKKSNICEDITELLEILDIETNDKSLKSITDSRLDSEDDNFIDFVVEDVLVEYLSSLNLKNGIDYEYLINNNDDDSDFTTVYFTLIVKENQREFHVYSWSHSSILVGGENGDADISGGYVILENNIRGKNKQEVLKEVSEKYQIALKDLCADEILVD